ncbi:MAG: hypothetical protein AAFR27_08260, partial [Pseudomonadota bacterium]
SCRSCLSVSLVSLYRTYFLLIDFNGTNIDDRAKDNRADGEGPPSQPLKSVAARVGFSHAMT